MAAHQIEPAAMSHSSINLPVSTVADDKEHRSNVSGPYPRLFRAFAGSTVAAALCGFAALASYGDKGLHPAPFLALATLLAIVAAGAFLSMLACLLTGAAARWWKR